MSVSEQKNPGSLGLTRALGTDGLGETDQMRCLTRGVQSLWGQLFTGPMPVREGTASMFTHLTIVNMPAKYGSKVGHP